MHARYTVLLATALACVGSATAAPVTPFTSAIVLQVIDPAVQPDESGMILVQNRGGGGRSAAGGGRQNSARSANRGGNFNSNDFHRDVSNSRSANVNRNTTVNANRNVNVNGGCCNGNYDDGPSWGGVAAGVAVGAVVGAAASSATQSNTYAAPPPTYPPGYVAPPPY
jgi:hypothetical protein